MALLVKLITNDDGCAADYSGWCATIYTDGSNRTLCTGEVFGEGESVAVFETKNTGKVTCRRCIEVLKTLRKFEY